MADKPVTREEKYLAYLTGDYKGELPKPITRKEKYLYELCLKGIGGEISPEEIKNAVNEYLEKNPVKPGATTEQAQQIEQNKNNISSLKGDLASKADKTSLAQTDRKLDALWKLNQGISYEFQTDDTEAYQKTVPSGAKMANVKNIGGKTIVWNQMVQNGDFSLNSMWSAVGSTISVEGNTGIFTATEAALTNNKIEAYQILSGNVVKGHKYCARFEYNLSVDINDQSVLNLGSVSTKIPVVGAGTWGKFNSIATVNVTSNIFDLYFYFDSLSVGDTVKLRNVQLFDLTQMFGSSNEPSTPEEFEAMFPSDYYPYNAGELMSAPVNEVVEHGKNYFDFSKLASDGVNVIDYNNQTITVPAYTNNTGYNQTLRDLCPGITPGTYVLSMKRSNTESIAGSFFLEANKDFTENIPTELTDECLDSHITWYNNVSSNIENVISEIQIEKNSVKTLYSQYYQKSHKIPQAILNLEGYGESGNFVDFVEKKYHKGDRTIDISDIIGDTFQEPLEVEAGGTLTFKNSHGDNYRIPVPSFEEYVISLAEVAK